MQDVIEDDEVDLVSSRNPITSITRLYRDDREHANIFHDTLHRIQSMSARLSGMPHLLIDRIWQMWAAKRPELGLWAMCDADGVVRGHTLGFIEPYNSRMVGWIQQMETDTPASKDIKSLMIHLMEQWVGQYNSTLPPGPKISELLMSSHRMTDAWARHAGFDLHRVVFRRTLS